MFQLMVIFSAIIVLHGVNSHNFPKQLLKVTKNVQPLKHIKRQDFNINDECFGEELNKRSPECVSKFFAAGLPDDLDSFASIVCSSDCGQIVLDSLRACGATRAEARLFADLCGTNSDGVVCYSIFADFAESEEDDVDVCPSTETCPSTCQSTLTQVVRGGSRGGVCGVATPPKHSATNAAAQRRRWALGAHAPYARASAKKALRSVVLHVRSRFSFARELVYFYARARRAQLELEARAGKYVWGQMTHFRVRCQNVGSTNQISVTGKEYVNVTCPDGRE
jgi:hypothetical protein